MNRNLQYCLLVISLLSMLGCSKKSTAEKSAELSVPVTITAIDTTAIESYTDLNATTTYLIKNTIKANTTGYLENVNVVSNNYVRKGQLLFAIKTREAKVLGNTINKIDPSLHFGSPVAIRATTSGFVSAVNVQQGDYVQDGDLLAVINDAQSFSIVLSLPYDLKKYVKIRKSLDVFLPDGSSIKANVESFMPNVDPVSQTQGVVLKCLTPQNIPENLIVKVRIAKSSPESKISLPKRAVLSDETETDFWIMKMTSDNTAVKVIVKKGIETEDRIEIVSPKLTLSDRILLTGNYGVADTIKVKILNK